MDKINTYDQLLARYPWLDEQLRHNPQLAALMIFNLGLTEGVAFVLERAAIADEIRDWQQNGTMRDS